VASGTARRIPGSVLATVVRRKDDAGRSWCGTGPTYRALMVGGVSSSKLVRFVPSTSRHAIDRKPSGVGEEGKMAPDLAQHMRWTRQSAAAAHGGPASSTSSGSALLGWLRGHYS